MSERGNVIFIAGLCVLAFAIFSSLLATLGTMGEEWRTVGVLKFNPKDVTQWTMFTLTLGVLPIATGLALVVTPFILREKTSAGWEKLLYLLVGGFFAAWGILYFRATYISYTKALSLAAQSNVTNITDSLNAIYIGFGCIAVLWLVSGLFLSVTSVCVRHAQQPDGNKSRGRLLRE